MFTWEMNRAVESTFAVINVSNKKFHENPKLYVRKLEGSGCTYVLELFGYDDKILTETYLTQDMVDQLIMNLELAKAKAEVAQA